MTEIKKIKLGTRGSALALAQTNMVKAKINALFPEIEIKIIIIQTSGDWKPEQGEIPLSDLQSSGQWAGKGLFTKEIQQAILDGTIDAAVHSMKDVESLTPNSLKTHHMLERADPRDAIVLRHHLTNVESIADIPLNSLIGTSSVRRAAFLKHKRSDLRTTPIRGNVQTRLDKLHKQGKADALFLAAAGLKRLGLEKEISFALDPNILLPSAGQGAIGLEIKQDNHKISAILDQISHTTTVLCVLAERAAIKELGGNCSTPIGAHATIDENNMLNLNIALADPEGKNYWEKTCQATVKTIQEAEDIGKSLGIELYKNVPQNALPKHLE